MSVVDEPKIHRDLVASNAKFVHAAIFDVVGAFRAYKDLKSDTELYMFDDGKNRLAFKIYGTIPIQYKGSIYNIPISIFLYDAHPHYAPICYVVPGDSMVIKESKHVNKQGRIFLPYLSEWRSPGYDLHGLIQIIVLIFQDNCPLFSRPAVPPHQFPPQAAHRARVVNCVEHEQAGRIVHQKDVFVSDFLTRFKPQRVLGRGGFGCVFEARNLMDEWTYAVKRIHLTGSAQSVNDALKEVRTLASFKHEGIVSYNNSWIEKPPQEWQKQADAILFKNLGYEKTFDYGSNPVFIYIQMEMCKGTLDDWLENNQSRDIKRAKLWFKQIVSAIAYLHQKNKIHRDLKPSNILFDVNGRLKICDLGLIAERYLNNGKEVEIKRTITGTRMYMAPEQHIGNYTSKVDIFSLGLILAELCVHMTLYKAYEVFMNYQGGRPNTVLKHLPEVDKMVSWLTNFDPKKRPTCEEILPHTFLA